jgi:hypothetical protein
VCITATTWNGVAFADMDVAAATVNEHGNTVTVQAVEDVA